jgi:hypothetical protein
LNWRKERNKERKEGKGGMEGNKRGEVETGERK